MGQLFRDGSLAAARQPHLFSMMRTSSKVWRSAKATRMGWPGAESRAWISVSRERRSGSGMSSRGVAASPRKDLPLGRAVHPREAARLTLARFLTLGRV